MKYPLILTIAALALLNIYDADAQINISGDYSRFVSLNPRLARQNASSLSFLPVDRIAVVEGHADKGNGGLVDYSRSDDCLGLGAFTESYYRFSPKTVFFGRLEYSYFTGKNMGGSAFFRPDSAPFNFVEYSVENAGTKNSEVYNLVGGLGVDLTSCLKFGIKVDYTSYNYSKTRDYRHANSGLDLVASAGLTWRAGDSFSAGLNYSFRKNVEEITFNSFGTTEKLYYTLIDYGAFYGKIQESESEGIVEKNDAKPLVDNYHGGALQFDFDFGGNIAFYNEFSFNYRSGRYGQNTTSKVLYTVHDALIAGYSGILDIASGANRHQIIVSGEWESLQNNENIYQKSTQDGITTVSYYGSNRVLDRTTIDASIGYKVYLGLDGYTPEWLIDMKIRGYYRSSEVNVTYPFYRNQTIVSADITALIERNITAGKNTYSPEILLRYGMGGGDKCTDNVYSTPSDKQKKPDTMEIYLGRQWEYLTSPQMSAGVGFRFARMTKSGLTWYCKASYMYSQAFEYTYLANGYRHGANLSAGFVF